MSAPIRELYEAWLSGNPTLCNTDALSFEAGYLAALLDAQRAVEDEFLEDQSDARPVTPDDEAYQHAVADCLDAVRSLVPTRSDAANG
jgi:hypothetical protein